MIMAGDWDMPFTMRILTNLNCPTKAVLGNGDPDIQKFEYQLQNLPILKGLRLEIQPRFLDWEISGRRIGVFHGDDDNLTNFLIECQLFDLVCIGHTHVPEIKKEGKTIIVNPGSLIGYLAEKGEVPVTYSIYDTETNQVELLSL